jgi:hypothetical protein
MARPFLVPFRRLLRLAGSRWRYSTPPPHGFGFLLNFEHIKNVKCSSFWDVTPCSPLKVHRRFGWIYCLHLQGRRIRRIWNQRESRWQAKQLPALPKFGIKKEVGGKLKTTSPVGSPIGHNAPPLPIGSHTQPSEPIGDKNRITCLALKSVGFAGLGKNLGEAVRLWWVENPGE